MTVQAEIDGKVYSFDTTKDLQEYVAIVNSKTPQVQRTPEVPPPSNLQPPTSAEPVSNAPVGGKRGASLRVPMEFSTIGPQQGTPKPLVPTTVAASDILAQAPTSLRGLGKAVTSAPSRIDNMARAAVAGPTIENRSNPSNPSQGVTNQYTRGANVLRAGLGEVPASPIQAAEGLRDVGGPNIVPLLKAVDYGLPPIVAEQVKDILTSPTNAVISLVTHANKPSFAKVGEPTPEITKGLDKLEKETKGFAKKATEEIQKIPIAKSLDKLTEVDELSQFGLHPIDLNAPEGATKAPQELSKIKMMASGFFEPVNNRLDKLGDAGKKMKEQIALYRRIKAQRVGEGENFLEKTFKGLTDAELSNVTNVMLNETKPINDRVKHVVTSLQERMSEVVTEGLSKGMKIAPTSGKIINVPPGGAYEVNGKNLINKLKKNIRVYVPEQDTFHFPRVATEGAIEQFRAPGAIEKKANELVRAQKFENVDQARQYLLEFKKSLEGGRATGRLEIASKNLLTDFERDPRVALSKYFEDSYNRLAEIESFGLADKKITRLYNQIEGEFGERGMSFAQDAFRSIIGDYALVGKNVREASRTLRDAQVITKLGLGQITNSGQSANTYIRTNARAMYQGFKDLMTPEGKEFARAAGAFSDVMHEALGGNSKSSASRFLELTGFSKTEKFNRGLAALSGKNYAEQQLAKLAKLQSKYGAASEKVTKSFAAGQLQELGIHPWEAVNRGYLTDQELKNAAYKIVKDTQFTSHAEDLPLFWNSPEGKVLTQFKSFALQHAKFMKHAIYDEAKKGNVGPLLRAVVASATIGEGVHSVKETVKSGFTKYPGQDLVTAVKEMQDTGKISPILDHELDNFFTIGALGLWTDAADAAKQGSRGILEFLGGPTIEDVSRTGGPLFQLGSSTISGAIGKGRELLGGEPLDTEQFVNNELRGLKDVGKQVVRHIPVAGTPIYRLLFNKDNGLLEEPKKPKTLKKKKRA